MDALPARDWISRCSARLRQHWPTIEPHQLDDLANDLWADAVLRAMAPEEAAVQWLRRGVLHG